jgi:hypothetical protein
MINWIINFYCNSGVVQFFFWGPVVFNMVFYPIHIWKRYQRNRKEVSQNEYGIIFITVGDLFKYLLLTIIPVLNALDVIFHSFPILFKYVAKRLDWLFGITLVKDTRKPKI